MKGFLSYLLLWIISKRNMTGAEISEELKKRRGTKPSPGTVYPALRELKDKGFIVADKNKIYSLTSKGEKELRSGCKVFCNMFYDIKDMLHSSR